MNDRRHLWVALVLAVGAIALALSAQGDTRGLTQASFVIGVPALLVLAFLTATRVVDTEKMIIGALAVGIYLFLHRLATLPVEDAEDLSALGHLAFRGITLLSGAAFIALGPRVGAVIAAMTWAVGVGLLLLGPMDRTQSALGSGAFGVAITSAIAILMFRLLSTSVADLKEEALESAELAFLDELTGLPNRRQMTVHLRGAVARVVEGGGPDTLVMFDLDRFKVINDTLGHDAGDEVLRRTAGVATAALRDGDVLGRWGGEEFLILLYDAAEEEGSQVAERCRRALEAVQGPTAVTGSFGVTTIHSADTITDALRRADLALYAAKDAGRNRVVARRAGDHSAEDASVADG